MRTITIGYSWGWTNIGDAAIAPGLLNLLATRFPDHRLQALTYGKGKTETILSSKLDQFQGESPVPAR